MHSCALSGAPSSLPATGDWLGVAVRGDSKLTVEQVNGRWGVKAAHLRPYVAECRTLLHALSGSLDWVPRDHNERADALSRQALLAPV